PKDDEATVKPNDDEVTFKPVDEENILPPKGHKDIEEPESTGIDLPVSMDCNQNENPTNNDNDEVRLRGTDEYFNRIFRSSSNGDSQNHRHINANFEQDSEEKSSKRTQKTRTIVIFASAGGLLLLGIIAIGYSKRRKSKSHIPMYRQI
ncbi:hypothetical protein ROZALSC1DRAFT_21817, partial [Rozella allomycis CSF55]